MTKEKLKHFEKKLKKEEKAILESIEIEGEDVVDFDIDGDMADRAEIINEAVINDNLSSSQIKILNKIKRSLQLIKEEKYGMCDICGKPIEEERLEAIPYTNKCKKHMKNK